MHCLSCYITGLMHKKPSVNLNYIGEKTLIHSLSSLIKTITQFLLMAKTIGSVWFQMKCTCPSWGFCRSTLWIDQKVNKKFQWFAYHKGIFSCIYIHRYIMPIFLCESRIKSTKFMLQTMIQWKYIVGLETLQFIC